MVLYSSTANAERRRIPKNLLVKRTKYEYISIDLLYISVAAVAWCHWWDTSDV